MPPRLLRSCIPARRDILLGPPEKAERPNPVCWAPFDSYNVISIPTGWHHLLHLVISLIQWPRRIVSVTLSIFHSRIRIYFHSLSWYDIICCECQYMHSCFHDPQRRRLRWPSDWDGRPNCRSREPDPLHFPIVWPKRGKSKKACKWVRRNAATLCVKRLAEVARLFLLLLITNKLLDSTSSGWNFLW